MTNPVRFAMVGGGWRSEFFFRICRELPDQFDISGVLVRDASKGSRLTQQWGLPTYTDLDDLLRTNPMFVVVSVPWGANPGYLLELANRGIPVLSETPPAPDLDALTALNQQVPGSAKIQVAEQYQYQPLNAAIIALVEAGKLGSVTQAQVSVAHGYHGISLLRKMLGLQFENADIRGFEFKSPLVAGPDRGGPPRAETMAESHQGIVSLQFGDKFGIFDFTGDQYFSWIRSRRLLVRGDRGEINNTEVRYLYDYRTPITETLTRMDAGQDGNLEGYYHKGILSGREWVYCNPFAPGRLSDDEIAIATCLRKMAEHVEGGPSFYSLAEASQDHYLAIEMQSAISQQTTITTSTHCWANSGYP